VAVDTSRVTAPAPAGAQSLLDDGAMNFLFVSRILPNKMIEDHLKLAAFYTRWSRRPISFRRPMRSGAAALFTLRAS
jgi:hypothetical protein